MPAKAQVRPEPRATEGGHCQHCKNAWGRMACGGSDHMKPCKQCGAFWDFDSEGNRRGASE